MRVSSKSMMLGVLGSCLAAILSCSGSGEQSAAPDWTSKMALGGTTLLGSPDPAFSQEELPGFGHKFELGGSAEDSADPQNETNDTVATIIAEGANGTEAQYAVALRKLTPGPKIGTLTNQLSLKYYFVDRTCGGGSPRIQLAIDLDGDGDSDGNAFGYVGPPGSFVGCDVGVWQFQDLCDEEPRWDLSQFTDDGLTVAGWVVPWSAAVAAVEAFPDHRVLTAALVDDTFAGSSATAGSPDGVGHAHYDLVTLDNRTLENDLDTVR